MSYFPDVYMEGLNGNTKNVITAGWPTEIRTEHLPNSSLLRRCYNRHTVLTDDEIWSFTFGQGQWDLLFHLRRRTLAYYCAVYVCTAVWRGSSVTLWSGSLKIRRFRATRLNMRGVLCGDWGFTSILFRSCGKSYRMAFARLCLRSKWEETSHIYLQTRNSSWKEAKRVLPPDTHARWRNI